MFILDVLNNFLGTQFLPIFLKKVQETQSQ